MAYDDELADRVREALAGQVNVDEKKMFGCLEFLINGNAAVGVLGTELILRLGYEGADDALSEPHTRVFALTGRPIKSWVLVAREGLETDEQLTAWVARGAAHARTFPPKAAGRKTR